MKATVAAVRPSMLRSPRRLALASLGVVCVGLAGLGVVIPGLPTTIFLIAASYLFTKSCPWLEERLIHRGPFRPYLQYLDGRQPMPLRARVSALVMMWAAVTASLAMLAARDAMGGWIPIVIIGAACCGTVVIVSIRRA